MRMKFNTTCHITGFEKTIIATLLGVAFAQIPTIAQEVQIPDDFPGKGFVSISLVTLPDREPITQNNTLVVGKYSYVNRVDQPRWVVFFNDPTWSSLSELKSLNAWTPPKVPGNDKNGASFPGRTELGLTVNRTNFTGSQDDIEAINAARISVFGAFYDGKEKANQKLETANSGKYGTLFPENMGQ